MRIDIQNAMLVGQKIIDACQSCICFRSALVTKDGQIVIVVMKNNIINRWSILHLDKGRYIGF